MKRNFIYVLLMILIIGVLSGCQGKKTTDTGSKDSTTQGASEGKTDDNANTVITAMCVGVSSESHVEYYKKIINNFNETNDKGIRVEMDFFENEQYKTRLTTLMASNSVPDVFFTWELSFLEPFVRGGKVADITSYLEADPDWKASFGDGTLDVLAYDDKNYAIPTQKTLCVMFYNKEIFEENNVEVPETYEEFFEVCEKLKANGVTPMALCGQDAWIPAQMVQQISNGIAGIELFEGINRGERKWNDPAHIEAANEVKKMADNGYFQNGFLGTGPDEATAMFETGQTAMYFMGAWDAGRISVSEVGEKVGAFILPAKNPEYNNISVGSVDTSFGISETCKNKDAAIEFLKFWSSEESELMLLYEQGRMPAGRYEFDESQLEPLFAEVVSLSNQQAGLTPWWDRAFGAGEGVEFNNTCVAVLGGEDAQEMFDDLQQFAEKNQER
jgi:raffinose/stachyose/melibiose transport system substrate-binding protein